MTTRRTPLLVALATAAAALAVPGAALAVTGKANQRCYSHVPTAGTQPIVVGMNGGIPGGGYVLTASYPGKGWGSAGSTDGNFDAGGNAIGSIPSVFPRGGIGPKKGQRIDLAVRQYPVDGTPSFDTPLGSVLITNFTISVASKPISPRKRRRVTVSGTPFAHKRVYGFVVKGKSRHVLHRFRIGKGNVCGYVSHKAVVAPRHYHLGRYRLYVNAGKKLNRHKALRYDFRIYRRY
jgi:hypothetical protein